jgi:hypothetical protein
MNQRTAGIAGIAAAGLAAIVLLAPTAAASPAVTLAPGVECGDPVLQCRNDTDQTYRIDWTATCIYAYASVGPITVPEQTWIAPHERITLSEGPNDAFCPLEDASSLDNPGLGDYGGVGSAQYIRAVVDSSHTPAPPAATPTGSAG